MIASISLAISTGGVGLAQSLSSVEISDLASSIGTVASISSALLQIETTSIALDIEAS